jgi:NhaA family Na+:H+ antiporter
MPTKALRDFLKTEAAGGILLVISAALALIVANTPLSHLYARLLDTPVPVQVGALEIAKPLLLWINDGLMAVFFLLVGLELKREIREGGLRSRLGSYGQRHRVSFSWSSVLSSNRFSFPTAPSTASGMLEA